MSKNRITIISYPIEYGLGGGAKREYHVIKEFLNYIDAELYFPFRYIVEIALLKENNSKIVEYAIKSLENLENKGLFIPNHIFYLLENKLYIDSLYKTFTKNKKVNFLKYALNLEKFESMFIEKIIRNRELNPEKSQKIYIPHELFEFIFPGYFIAKKYNKDVFILLQESPFLRIKTFYRFFKYNAPSTIIYKYNGEKSKKILIYLNKNNYLKKVLAVSHAPIILSNLNNYLDNYKVLKIGNAFNKKLLKFRKFKKENYLVFYSRLVPEKGILEIPLIVNEIKKVYEDIKLFVIGSFTKSSVKTQFLNLVKKLKLENNIILTGFLNEKKLYKIVSKAKVLIYPSHQDSYSLVILESLALGTSVVAYDIPAILSKYRKLRPVKIVKEENIKEMAKKSIEILNQNLNEYKEEHNDKNTLNFLNLHSSWKNVALEELKELGFKI
ncbi:MAG: glycosyltransferase [Candidatus Aenigmatarchaeota archaeon]